MTSVTKAPPKRFTALSLLLRWEWLLVLLIIVACFVNASLSKYFLDVDNLFDMTFNFMEKSLVALAMTFIIISGNIDLSVASNLAMSAVIMATTFQSGLNIWLAVLLGLFVGTVGGLINGLLISRVRLPALVVTLGTYAFYRGVAFVLLGDLVVKGLSESFMYIGQGNVPNTPIPVPLLLFSVMAVLFGLVLHRTTFGRFIYAIGNNEETCRYSGVAVGRIKIIIFALSGFMSALAGVVMTARFGSVRPNIAAGLELDVITAVVLGGVNIFGGQGSILGVVLALFLIGIVRFGMSLKNVPGQIQSTLIGFLLILAILLPQLLRRLAPRLRG